MQPVTPVKSQSNNRCPDCLFLDIDSERESKCTSFQVVLKLTLNFNEKWEEVPFGRVKFGLRGGELRLLVSNGSVPYSNRHLNPELQFFVPKEVSRTQGNELQESGEAGLSVKAVNAKINSSRKKSFGSTEKIAYNSYQVSSKGDESNLAWVFDLKNTDVPVLIGLLDCKLCTVNIFDTPCDIEATFNISKRDIYITATEGIWPSNISSNKRAAIEREIFFAIIKDYIDSHISKTVLQVSSDSLQEDGKNEEVENIA